MATAIVERVHELPLDFLREVVDMIFKAYKTCFTEVSTRFPAPEAKDLLPHYRRAWIDKELRAICLSYKEHGIASLAKMNQANNCSHTEVSSKGVILTVSSVPVEDQLFRSARFRDTLAKRNQPTLFDMTNYEPTGNAFYGTILHYQDPREPKYPKFVALGFPDRHCSEWVEHFNLVQFCGIDVKQYLNDVPTIPVVSEEVIEDAAKPKLKNKKVRQEA